MAEFETASEGSGSYGIDGLSATVGMDDATPPVEAAVAAQASLALSGLFSETSAVKPKKNTSAPCTKLPAPRIPREFHAVAAWNRDSLVIVGGRSLETKECLGSVEIFNFTTQSWTLLEARMHQPRRHCAAAIVDGRYLYVIGGNSNADRNFLDIDTLERLDLLDTVKFTVVERHLPFPIRNTIALVHENLIFLVGGYSSKQETAVLSKLKRNDGTDADTSPGYCNVRWVWDTRTETCRKLPPLSRARWLPAVAMVRGEVLVVAGGYNGRMWLNDVELFHVKACRGGAEDLTVPRIPCEAPPIHAYWSRMNQLTILSKNKTYIWDWGSTKWRIQPVFEQDSQVQGPIWKRSNLEVPRSATSPAWIVCADSNNDLWSINRPAHIGESPRLLKMELDGCTRDIEAASQVGFWELAALGKAAAAKARIPLIEAKLEQLDTIRRLQTQKDALIEGFRLSQSSGDWEGCQRIAWDIKDVERDLEKAYIRLEQLQRGTGFVAKKAVFAESAETKEFPVSPSNQDNIDGLQCSPLRRKRSLLWSDSAVSKAQLSLLENQDDDKGDDRGIDREGRRIEDGKRKEDRRGRYTREHSMDDLPSLANTRDDSGVFDLTTEHGSSDRLDAILFEGLPPDSPEPIPVEDRRRHFRRKSSLMLQGLLSNRDLKELARSSDQDHLSVYY